jgi:hypothetical protein
MEGMPPPTAEPESSVTPLPPSRQREAGLGRRAANIDVWPAAGGGLLVSLALPLLRPSLQARSRFGTFFLKICSWGGHALAIPYVRLDQAGIDWLVDLACDELSLPIERLRVTESRPAASRNVDAVALFKAEWQFRAAAAAARNLLLAEAAYVWRADPRSCRLRDGRIVQADREGAIDDFAAGAALQPFASRVRLRCGREIRLSPQLGRAADFASMKDAWLAATHS